MNHFTLYAVLLRQVTSFIQVYICKLLLVTELQPELVVILFLGLANLCLPLKCLQTRTSHPKQWLKVVHWHDQTWKLDLIAAIRCSNTKCMHANKTALPKYVWKYTDENIDFTINWSIIKLQDLFVRGSKVCSLCLTEKLCISDFNGHRKHFKQKKRTL